MRPDTLAFISVAAIVVITPGIDMALVARNGISGGLRSAMMTSAGILGGVVVHATAAILGLSAILATSATAFRAVKFLGGLYLIYLGMRSIWNVRRQPDDEGHRPQPSVRPFVSGLLTNLLNPKLAVMFISLLPQFVAPGDPAVLRTTQLAAIFLALGPIWLVSYSWFVSRVRHALTKPTMARIVEGISGTVLLGLGVRVLATDR